MDEFIGIIRPFAGNYAPRGWALCDGSLLPIRQYTALFAILGKQYGGDGVTTFGLPDLRGRMVVGSGTIYDNAETGGVVSNTLTLANMPSHTHMVNSSLALPCNLDGADTANPVGQIFSIAETNVYADNATSGAAMAPLTAAADYTVANAGGGVPYDNRMPYVAMTYIICVEGDFPVRN